MSISKQNKIAIGLLIGALIWSTLWWKNEFNVYPFETSLANYVKKDMIDNYFAYESNFDSISLMCSTMFPFERLKFPSSNSIEFTVITDGYYDDSSLLIISNSNIDKYYFENGYFKPKKGDNTYYNGSWLWNFKGGYDNEYLAKYLKYKQVKLNRILSLKEQLNRINCYSITSNGKNSFHFKYNKLSFLNLDYFTDDSYNWFSDHSDTIRLNEIMSIGKCYINE